MTYSLVKLDHLGKELIAVRDYLFLKPGKGVDCSVNIPGSHLIIEFDSELSATGFSAIVLPPTVQLSMYLYT